MTQNETKTFPPNLKVAIKKGEAPGIRRIKTVAKQQQVNGEWVARTDGKTKQEAEAVNTFDVVMAFPDAYKEKDAEGNMTFPTVPFPPGYTIGWRFFIVGPKPVNDEGDELEAVPVLDVNGKRTTRVPLPIEVQWNDRTDGHWMYERMTRIIGETLEKFPNTKIRDHVFEFGKRPSGNTPNGTFGFIHKGLLSELYPNITLPSAPANPSGGASAAPKQPRSSGPSEAVLKALPKGVSVPQSKRAQEAVAQAQAVAPSNVSIFSATPAPAPAAPEFAPTEVELKIAKLLTDHLAKQGLTIRGICEGKGITPEVMLANSFTQGGARDPTNNEVLRTTPERAAIIGKNPSLVGITV